MSKDTQADLPAARVVADHDPDYAWARGQLRRAARHTLLGGAVMLAIGIAVFVLLPSHDDHKRHVILKNYDGSPGMEVILPPERHATDFVASGSLIFAGIGAVVMIAGAVNLVLANRTPRITDD